MRRHRPLAGPGRRPAMRNENARDLDDSAPHRLDNGTVVTAANCLRMEVWDGPALGADTGSAVALQPLAVKSRVGAAAAAKRRGIQSWPRGHIDRPVTE